MFYKSNCKFQLFCLFLSSIFFSFCTNAQDIGIGAFLDKSSYETGDSPQLKIAGFNQGDSEILDVHVALISPDGVLYEYPDWNESFSPWIKNQFLPKNYELPITDLTDLDTVPGGLSRGIWQVVAALTEPETLNVVVSKTTSFSVDYSLTDSDLATGISLLSYQDDRTEQGTISVSASGVFYQSLQGIGDSINFQDNGESSTNELDQCNYLEFDAGFDLFGDILELPTLDAGESLSLLDANGEIQTLTKNEFNGFVFYETEPQPPVTFYQAGQNYTLDVSGSAQVGSFQASAFAPTPFLLTEPQLGLFNLIDTRQDWALRWNGNHGISEVDLTISGFGFTDTGMSGAMISCRLLDDGAANISSNLLLQLRDKLTSFPVNALFNGIPGADGSAIFSLSRNNQSILTIPSEGELEYGGLVLETKLEAAVIFY